MKRGLFLPRPIQYSLALICGFAVTFEITRVMSDRRGLRTDDVSPCLASLEQPFSVPRTHLGWDFSVPTPNEVNRHQTIDSQSVEILPLREFSSRDGTRLSRLAEKSSHT